MKKIDVLDQTGKSVEQVELNAAIFDAPINPSLVAQAIRVRLINARTGTAHTKTRAEVSGGGRKPWRQKGTGRARHGSTRSPIWTGGGITFGPRFHKPHATMPTSMRRAALFSSLSDKLQQEKIIVLDNLDLKQSKTKLISDILAKLTIGRSALIVAPTKNEQLIKAARNLDNVKVMVAPVLHPYEVLHYQTVIILKDSLSVLEDTFVTKTESSKAEPQAKPAAKTTKKPVATKKSATATKAKSE